MSSFENLRIVDNFYQTSLFFPMPTVIISTLCEDGTTNLGPYSLVQPYYVAGKDYYAMLLCCRNSSNTAQNILRNGKCTLNFIDDKPKNFKEAVKMFSWFKRKKLESYLFYESSEKYILLASTIKGGLYASLFKGDTSKVC